MRVFLVDVDHAGDADSPDDDILRMVVHVHERKRCASELGGAGSQARVCFLQSRQRTLLDALLDYLEHPI